MSVFTLLKNRVEAHAGKRTPDELIPGVRYPVYSFTQRKSDYIDKKTQTHPMTLVAYVIDPKTSGKYYITLPSLYNDLDIDQVKELNDAILPGKAPVIVFYGKDGKRNDVLIHRHDEDTDECKLKSYQDNSNLRKRKHDADGDDDDQTTKKAGHSTD
ncbi:uncharacterized protein LOC117651103 [Thrips palmi]|uniref:Uncharacterized protein LOC117651103 n=1 Tax=Thrips palmi TaxID=161013 RepID=A0A6P9A1L2_THRPL|nr:uncharacterized protein LOC117651103 [Thrips palmi]